MSLVDVSELMSDPAFMRPGLTLRRPTVRLADEGVAIQSYGDDVPLTASVQPASAADMQRFEREVSASEGERGGGRFVTIYSATELRTSSGKTDLADLVVVPDPDGGTFRVIGTEPWGPHGYYKSIAVEIIP